MKYDKQPLVRGYANRSCGIDAGSGRMETPALDEEVRDFFSADAPGDCISSIGPFQPGQRPPIRKTPSFWHRAPWVGCPNSLARASAWPSPCLP
jgi:hypothetical protein